SALHHDLTVADFVLVAVYALELDHCSRTNRQGRATLDGNNAADMNFSLPDRIGRYDTVSEQYRLSNGRAHDNRLFFSGCLLWRLHHLVDENGDIGYEGSFLERDGIAGIALVEAENFAPMRAVAEDVTRDHPIVAVFVDGDEIFAGVIGNGGKFGAVGKVIHLGYRGGQHISLNGKVGNRLAFRIDNPSADAASGVAALFGKGFQIIILDDRRRCKG